MRERIPFDVESVRHKAGICFICEFISGKPEYRHIEVARSENAIAFMSKYPTLEGYVLVAPLAHKEQVAGDFRQLEYLDLQKFVFQVAEAVREVMKPERVYILSLGSQAANAHVHWHIAPLPPKTPLEQQQYYALMHENGVIETSDAELTSLAEKIGAAVNS